MKGGGRGLEASQSRSPAPTHTGPFQSSRTPGALWPIGVDASAMQTCSSGMNKCIKGPPGGGAW